MLASITRVEELAITPDESASLAGALHHVNSFYNIPMAEKTLAWVNLSMVAGTIYGTRILAIRARRQNTRRAASEPTTPTPGFDASMRASPEDVAPNSTKPLQPVVVSMDDAMNGFDDDFIGTPGLPRVN